MRRHDSRKITMRDGGGSSAQLRARIAAEAARVISESGIRDYAFARRKAAARFDAREPAAMPDNEEIEAALRAHQRLFHADEQPRTLRRLRRTALAAMRFFAAFEPRLVGAVLEGTADGHSAVSLHLFCDDADAPVRFLDERNLRYEMRERRMRHGTQEAGFTTLRFVAEDATIDATLFPVDALRQAPTDPRNGRAMRRATIEALELLLSAEGDTI
ncbi:MAG: hypothetical protein ABI846_10220 [Rudaea sp.]